MGKFDTTAGVSLPAMKGNQGGRDMYLCVTSHATLNNFFPRDTEIQATRAQRPYDPRRASTIAEYMTENKSDYVLGTLTYAIDRAGKFEPAEPGAAIGMLHLPLNARLRCIDGQHRRGAIKEALEVFEELAKEEVALLIYIETDLEKRKQMFSDMNWHQKPVSKSVNIGFDSRDPFARVTQALADSHPLLKGRVERDRPSVGRSSEKLFTLGAVYDALGRLCTGAGGRLRDKSKFGTDEELLDLGRAFFDLLLEARPEFKETLEKPQRTMTMRAKCILFSSTTLKMLASAIHIIRNTGDTKLRSLRGVLSQLDFSPRAKIWRDSGFVSPGKTTPNARLQEIKSAAEIVAHTLQADRPKTKGDLGRSASLADARAHQ
jgi:DGQHR domain-containing protein